jgi:hypothetical protein
LENIKPSLSHARYYPIYSGLLFQSGEQPADVIPASLDGGCLFGTPAAGFQVLLYLGSFRCRQRAVEEGPQLSFGQVSHTTSSSDR